MRGFARTRRKEVKSESPDRARKEAGQHAGNDTSRRECLRETVEKKNMRKSWDRTRGNVSMPEDPL